MTFISISFGLFTAMLIYGLFDIDFSNSGPITKLLLKSFVVSIATGLVMGILNMFLKIGNFPKKEN